MKHSCLFILLYFLIQCFPHGCISQNLVKELQENYIPIKSEGTIPFEFQTFTQELVQQQLEKVKRSGDTESITHQKEYFLIFSNYELRKSFLSGRVLFGERISQYLNRVLDRLIENSVLKGKVKVFPFKSTVPNAFCTNQGYIFITTGLLARLNSEAELAFVLSHEFTHYLENHVMDSYLQYNRIISNDTTSSYSKLLTLSTYSKRKEFAADRFGVHRIKSAGYDLSTAQTVLQILANSELPVAESSFEMDWFETDHYAIPKHYFPDYVRSADTVETGDHYSSHPNISRRISEVSNIIKNQYANIDDEHLYLDSEDDFNYAKLCSQFENIRIGLVEDDYMRTVINCIALLKQYPNNHYLNKSLAICFYSMYKSMVYANSQIYDFARTNPGEEIPNIKVLSREAKVKSLIGNPETIYGNEYMLHHVITKMPEQHLCALTIKMFLRLDSTGYNHNNLKCFMVDICSDYFTRYERMNKTIKCEYITKSEDKSSLNQDALNSVEREFLKNILSEEDLNATKLLLHQDSIDRFNNLLNNQPQVDSVVLIKTDYIYTEGAARGKEAMSLLMNYYTSEKKELKQYALTRDILSNNGSVVKSLHPSLVHPDSNELFNDAVRFYEWISELRRKESYSMIPSSYAFMGDLSKKYKSQSILYNGVYAQKLNRHKTFIELYELNPKNGELEYKYQYNYKKLDKDKNMEIMTRFILDQRIRRQ